MDNINPEFRNFCKNVGNSIAKWVADNSDEFCAPENSADNIANWMLSEQLCGVIPLSDYAYVDMVHSVEYGRYSILSFTIFIRDVQYMMLRDVASGNINYKRFSICINDDSSNQDHRYFEFTRKDD